ncbi:MAG: hypothetical protein JW725_05630 [Candidatus Babeliaceae bacterium]|nr:hypothetical protein [Candidatus Babeliaceae bacterium]
MHSGRSVPQIERFIRQEINAGRSAEICEEEIADTAGDENVKATVEQLCSTNSWRVREDFKRDVYIFYSRS